MTHEQLSFDTLVGPQHDYPPDLPLATPGQEDQLARAKELMAEPGPAQPPASEQPPSADKDYHQVELDDDAYRDVERGFINATLVRRRLAGKKAA